MDIYHHKFIRPSQTTLQFELPNDVLYEFMTTLKQINTELQITQHQYKLTGDELLCIALEDFNLNYQGQFKNFFKRINVDPAKI